VNAHLHRIKAETVTDRHLLPVFQPARLVRPVGFHAERPGGQPMRPSRQRIVGGPRPSQATPLRSVRSRGSGLDRASAAPNLRRLRDGHRSSRRGAQPSTHRSTTRREQRRYDPISSEAPSTDSTRNTAERGARSPRRAAARGRTHSCSPGRTRMVRAGSCRTESGATRGDSAVKVAIYAR